jgi:hypothetical protein
MSGVEDNGHDSGHGETDAIDHLRHGRPVFAATHNTGLMPMW